MAAVDASDSVGCAAPGPASAWSYKLEIIRPALHTDPRSAERQAVVKKQAARCGVSCGTIRRWVRAYEQHGAGGLCRASRSDKGQKRALVSRTWDRAAAGLDAAERERIAGELRRHVRSLWRHGAPGWHHVARLATKELVKLTRAAGLDLPDAELLRVCKLQRRFVEAERQYQLVATRDKDAKRFADRHLPRVRRTADGLWPMSVVVADVHHADIQFRRPDGTLCTPKAITWQDLATNRVFVSPVILAPGEGVRQDHVVRSFIELTQHPEWGMPGALYIDNGSELAHLDFIDDAMKLADLTQADSFKLAFLDDHPEVADLTRSARRSRVIRAEPYNAPAKAVEGVFGMLEKGALAMIPGWIGGDRMAKKTANVGREPHPFDGTAEDFAAALRGALDYYHTTPQAGHLAGQSPRQAFASAVEAGWRRVDVDPDALRAVFAREVRRKVRQGEVSIDARLYRADELLAVRGGACVLVRLPLDGDRSRLPVLDDSGNFLCIAEPTPVYGVLDPAGVRDKQRRRRVQSQMLSVMRRDTDRLDLVAEMREAAELHPDAPTPESAGTIRLSDEYEAIGQAQRALGPRKRRSDREEREVRVDAQVGLMERAIANARRKAG